MFIFAGVMCHVSTYVKRRDVTLIWLEYSLYKNIENFFQPYYGASQNYIMFIFAGVMWHVSTDVKRRDVTLIWLE